MIDRDAKPVGYTPPYKPIDIRHPNRPRIVTREQIEDGIYREPCREAYACDWYGNFILKD